MTEENGRDTVMREMRAPGCHLLVDTSGEQLLIGLVAEGKLIVSDRRDSLRQIEAISLEVESLVSRMNLEVSSISSIGVVVGPGSMAGLRVGVTFSKTLSYALGCGIVPLASHEVIANIYAETLDPVVVLRRVRKQEAFGAICARGLSGLTTLSGPVVLGPNQLSTWLGNANQTGTTFLVVSDRAPSQVLAGDYDGDVVNFHLPDMRRETCESMWQLMNAAPDRTKLKSHNDVAISYVRGADTKVSYQRLNSTGDLEWVKD